MLQSSGLDIFKRYFTPLESLRPDEFSLFTYIVQFLVKIGIEVIQVMITSHASILFVCAVLLLLLTLACLARHKERSKFLGSLN